MKQILTSEKIETIVSALPDEWLQHAYAEPVTEVRNIYSEYIIRRLGSSEIFTKEAENARKQLI